MKRNIKTYSKHNIKLKEKTYEATYRMASKSFGFAMITTGEEIFIASRDSKDAMSDDKVLIEIKSGISSGEHREGKVIKILKRETDKVIGYFEPCKGYGFVTPINKKIPFDIHIEKRFFGKAVKDSIVEVKLLSANHKGDNPEGIIVNVIGHRNDANAEITAIVKDFKIKDTFDDETLVYADRIAIPIRKSDLVGRVDLRKKYFITIDGADTKDIDDAVYLEKLKNGNSKLYVSIADVSHYVKEGSLLDKEALLRGNSVYLLDRVIPMLPHVLSNGMCSLNEGEDRLTMTCEMEFDDKGNIISRDIYESIINSHKRTTYDDVQAIMDDGKFTTKYEKMIEKMYELSRELRKKRKKRGAVNFNLSETYIEVDENLSPIKISEKKRLEAHEIIEDFMVAANESVAEEFHMLKVPFLYRTHEKCDDEKIKTLSTTLQNLGVIFDYKKEISPMDMQKLLKSVEAKPYQMVVEKLALRSMSQARYTKKALGHFALASKYYTHFTSPIRRYNDLQIHRIMKEVLNEKFTDKRRKHYEEILDQVALDISKTERLAIDCERDIDDLKKCEYMEDKVGNEYEVVISGLTNFGIFVELPNTIEGMIALRDIRDDHYVFDETKFEIKGERRKRVFRFGDRLKVQLVKVTKEIRAIDFILVD